MPERPIGHLDSKKAKKCKGLNCKLFNDNEYPTCSVKVYIHQGRLSPFNKQRAIGVYDSQIPNGCSMGYKK